MKYLFGFLYCGGVCLLGQFLYDHTKLSAGHITSIFVVVGTFLDFFNLYDYLIVLCGAGASLPITSFGHSLIHGGMSKIDEFGLLGISMGLFDLTASGITTTILFSFIAALIFKPKS